MTFRNDVQILRSIAVFLVVLFHLDLKYYFYEIKNIFCKSNCLMLDEKNKPLYFDNGHLILSGAKFMEPLFKQIFNNIYKN